MTGLEKRKGGRPSKKPTANELILLRSGGLTNKQIGEHFGVAESTVLAWLHQYRKELEKEETNG